ncbi:hypothetical protein [Dokdonia sp.]|uniref:hypothetical protein n=1 Tax=Dokdonia sp. TaxID=2024995 RepID=UPI0032677946
MKRTTIKINYLRTIDWFDNNVIDWNSAGTQYFENGETKQLQKYHFGFVCDGSITSENGEYVLIYQKLGTKGLLLRNGELLREINRSYYQSSVYEFPATFLTFKNRTYLVHCPFGYNQLDFEDAETGKIITNISKRKPKDIFHSRLEVSPDNKYIISKGWVWHPIDVIELFDIEKCFENPSLLDKGINIPNVNAEISTASFIDNDNILVCASKEGWADEETDIIKDGQIATWNFKTGEIINSVNINSEYGNIFAIDKTKCWDLFSYPKIIDLKSGEVIDKIEEIESGKQGSSVIHHLTDLPKIAFNKKTKQIAIAKDNTIEILTE